MGFDSRPFHLCVVCFVPSSTTTNSYRVQTAVLDDASLATHIQVFDNFLRIAVSMDDSASALAAVDSGSAVKQFNCARLYTSNVYTLHEVDDSTVSKMKKSVFPNCAQQYVTFGIFCGLKT
jgi:hypothetical protein